MSPHAPKINKLPFLMTDLVFLGAAAAIIFKSSQPIGGAQILAAVVCVALGAWAAITPFLKDHDIVVRLAEAEHLNDTVEEIKKLKTVAAYVQTATSHWQTLQANSDKTSASMEEMADRLSNDAKNFAESLQKASDVEKQNLRLEVEKLKRNEGEGLKIMVALMDHVFALYSAGLRSGQENVVQQLTGFQAACRDVVRRVGLVPIEAKVGEPFDPNVHQAHEGEDKIEPGTPIVAALATGYSFQGQMLRPALVTFGDIGQTLAGDSISEIPGSESESESGQPMATSDSMTAPGGAGQSGV